MMDFNVAKAPVYSEVLVKLLQGPVYQHDRALWPVLLQHRKSVLEYFGQMAVKLYVDEVEGYAFLKPLTEEEELAWKEVFENDPPRLISRRKLTYLQTLMLVILRKWLLDHDAMRGDTRLIVSRQEIHENIKVFLPDAHNQSKQEDSVEATINKIESLGILRKLPGDEANMEINRILKARITPGELDEILSNLKEYGEKYGE